MLKAYRRHLKTCPQRAKGRDYKFCDCPVWSDGMLHGKRVNQSLDTRNWDRAWQRLRMLEEPNCATGPGDPPRQTLPSVSLGSAIETYMNDARRRNLRYSTLTNYQRTLTGLQHTFSSSEVRSIDLAMLDRWCQKRAIAPRTMQKEIQHLRNFFRFAMDRGWIESNPACRLRKPRADDVPTLPFTAEEIIRLFDACDRIGTCNLPATPYIRRRARALLYVFLYSGLRISDVTVLRRAALNPAKGYLTVRITKNGVPLKVKLHADAVDALVSLPAQNPEYFFWTGRGNPKTCSKNIWETMHRLGKLAGVAGVRPHRFRDTFAVELLTTGADIRTVQKLLGHESVLTTERHYAHFVEAHQQLLDAATAKLDFSPKPARPLLVHPGEHRRRNAQ